MTDPTPAPAPEPTPAAAAPAAPAPGVDFPGKTLGIVGLVLAIITPLIGLIISAVANSQSKAAGYPNQLAKIGIIVGAVLTALGIIVGIVYGIATASLISTGLSTY